MIIREFISDPPPHRSVHAATLVETSNGILAAWFGGLREGFRDVSIWTARRTADGWSSPERVTTGHWGRWRRFPCWNPVLFQPSGGPLSLYYKVGSSPSRWWGMVIRSGDGGHTWSEPSRMANDILGPIKNKPIELPDGKIVSPSSTEDNRWRVHIEISRDGGDTWQRTKPLNDGREFAAIQPCLLRLADGGLIMLCRSRQGMIVQSRSAGDPMQWSALDGAALPNPDSGIDAVALKDGRFLLIYNHSAMGRTPLNLALSDNGITWRAAATLEHAAGEFSYPAIIQGADGYVHVAYTWNRRKLRYMRFDPASLEGRDFAHGAWPEPPHESRLLGE